MTAEIAIINRTAVTLAADSAMTMTGMGQRKISTSADKIFELSEHDPIALMIYNNLDFMGAPLDVVIKRFRVSSACQPFQTLQHAADAFLDHLRAEWVGSAAVQQRQVGQMLSELYAALWQALVGRIAAMSGPGEITDRVAILMEEAAQISEAIASLPVLPDLESLTEQELMDEYGPLLDTLIGEHLRQPPLSPEQMHYLRQIGTAALRRSWMSRVMTGLVFAGYGQADIFPRLLHVEIDGFVLGRLKSMPGHAGSIEMGCEHPSAHVIPFAQQDVVRRFLSGIDPQIEQDLPDYISTMQPAVQDHLFDGVAGLSAKARKQIQDNLWIGFQAMQDQIGKFLGQITESYSADTESMIVFMAKSEAAHLAESLVNITSLKRKFSLGDETVGGPIDVAVISRSEGFVWVKRKHYFPAELNERYHSRVSSFRRPTNGVSHA